MRNKLIKNFLSKYISENNSFQLIDIGSMGGPEKEWKDIESHIKIIGFEPDEREFEKLINDKNNTYFNKVIWSKSEKLSFYITQEPGKSSTLHPNTDLLKLFPNHERFEVVKTINFDPSQVQSLDTLFLGHHIGDADFLKLDTQGSELEILKGSNFIIDHLLLGLKIEVEFIELYKNQALFSEVDLYLRKKGFQLIDLKRFFWKRKNYVDFMGKGQLIFGEALYFKDIEIFFDSLTNNKFLSSKEKIIKFIILCTIYGLHDYAVFILTEAFHRSFFTKELYEDILKTLLKYDKKHQHLSFPGSHKIVGFLQRLIFKLQKNHPSWSQTDHFLGNSSYWT